MNDDHGYDTGTTIKTQGIQYKVTTREDQNCFGHIVPAGSSIIVDAAWFEAVKSILSPDALVVYDIQQVEVE